MSIWIIVTALFSGVLAFFWRKSRPIFAVTESDSGVLPIADSTDAFIELEVIPVEIDEDPTTTDTMADFDIAYKLVKRAEGGYQAHPNDRGNYNSSGELVGTNWGIAAFTYEAFFGKPPTKSQMKGMSATTARRIYEEMFWRRKTRGHEIRDQQVANIFFDGVVNHGAGVRLMQRVLGVTEDNAIGPETIGAINRADSRKLHDAYREARRKYYHLIVRNDENQRVFLKGWLRRIDNFKYNLSPDTRYTSRGENGGGTLGLLAAGVLTVLLS